MTELLVAVRDGDERAVDRLYPLVYEDLVSRARVQRRVAGGHATMNTTAIVHEAYLKLVDHDGDAWESRAHFFAVAAKAMRHVFLDYAKRKQALKRGGDAVHVPVDERVHGLPDLSDEAADRVVALNEALEQLGEEDDRAARVVECRFFGGLTVQETATALGISPATVKRDWVFAQARLYRMLRPAS